MKLRDRIASSILLKNNWRSDSIWTKNPFFKTFLRRIPIYADHWALTRSQYWAHKELEILQLKRITDLLSHSTKIPFWKDRFEAAGIAVESIRDLVDFSEIPILQKPHLMVRDSFDYCTSEPASRRAKIATIDHTSGSTGQPFYFYLDRRYELRSFAACERVFRIAGKGKRYPVISLRARFLAGFTGFRGSWFYLRSLNAIKYRLEALIQHVSKFQDGFILYGFTSYLFELARIVENDNVAFSPKAVITTGEQLLMSQRQYIADRLKCLVFSSYGARELGRIAFECEYLNAHVSSESLYMEILDEESRRVEYGKEGRIVVTTFDNYIMPFIRYDTGDRGTMYPLGSCACGRSLPYIEFSGRKTEVVRISADRYVSTLNLVTVFDDIPTAVRQFQIIQTAVTSFTIKVIPGPNFHSHAEELVGRLQRVLSPDIAVRWELVESISPERFGKRPLFKSLLTDA